MQIGDFVPFMPPPDVDTSRYIGIARGRSYYVQLFAYVPGQGEQQAYIGERPSVQGAGGPVAQVPYWGPFPLSWLTDAVSPPYGTDPSNPPTKPPPPVTTPTLIGPPIPPGGVGMHIQDLEAKIPGIGSALVKLTQGWDNLNWFEKGIIIAAVAFIGIDALAAVGVEVGLTTAIAGIMKGIPLLGNLFSGGSSSGGSGGGIVPAGFVRAWNANGVNFYRNVSTGQYGVLNKKGRWKQWRPRKPVGVVYADGVSNLKSLARTAKALRKQVRGIQEALTVVEGPSRKRIAAPKKYTPEEMRQIAAAVK